MSIVDIVLGGLAIGAAALMAVVTVGPMYFMFKVVPDMQEGMRKVYFVEKRRELRKVRAKAKRLKERGY